MISAVVTNGPGSDARRAAHALWSRSALSAAASVDDRHAQLRPKPSPRISSASRALWPEVDAPIPTKLSRVGRPVDSAGRPAANSAITSSIVTPRRVASASSRWSTSGGRSTVTDMGTSLRDSPDHASTTRSYPHQRTAIERTSTGQATRDRRSPASSCTEPRDGAPAPPSWRLLRDGGGRTRRHRPGRAATTRRRVRPRCRPGASSPNRTP